jgi:hypothetical protein
MKPDYICPICKKEHGYAYLGQHEQVNCVCKWCHEEANRRVIEAAFRWVKNQANRIDEDYILDDAVKAHPDFKEKYEKTTMVK